MNPMRFPALFPALFLAACAAMPLRAQENYEIQVYPSETADPGTTMFELHSNWTGLGTRFAERGVLPTRGAFHETLEITHGFSSVFEVGFYVFTSAREGDGWQVAGTHIRPRIRVPQAWDWPLGVSLSAEFGYVRKEFDAATWSTELRPIIDRQQGRLYWALNPVIDLPFTGPDAGRGLAGAAFNPSAKVSWEVHPKLAVGFEYYGAMGTATRLAPAGQQQHMLYPTLDLFLAPDWEFNLGFGVLAAGSGDHSIVKAILGRRFSF